MLGGFMRASLFKFVITSMFFFPACGGGSGGGDDSTTPAPVPEGAEAGGDEGSDAGESGGEGEGDAAAIDNATVKDKPLMTSCYKGDTFSCAVEVAIVAETNKVRGTRRALLHSFESSYVARDWSVKQAAEGNISHDGFPYERKKVLNADFPNARWNFSAENVGRISGSGSDPTAVAKQFVDMWENSAGHLQNINGNYVYIGAGVARAGNNIYATQVFH